MSGRRVRPPRSRSVPCATPSPCCASALPCVNHLNNPCLAWGAICPAATGRLAEVEPPGCDMNAALAGGYESPWMNEELAIFRDAVARFVESEMVPNETEWRKQQNVGKEIWRKAGAMGLLCTDVSAEYGGAGGDFCYETVSYEEL